MSQPTACPVCGPSATQPAFPDAVGPAKDHPLVLCQTCGLAFLATLPEDDDVADAHSTFYGQPTRRFIAPIELGVHLFRRSRMRLAERFLPETDGKVLDVGCGRGAFLQLLQQRGHDVRGTEYSAESAANALPGIQVDVGDLTTGLYADESFDLISIWHVLEHVRRPDEAIAACAAALKPGGALMIAVPNFDSIQARFGGEDWFHLDLPRHVYQFSPSNLQLLLEHHGLRVERTWTGSWEMDPFGLLQTAQNRLGRRRNAIYDTLRNHPVVREDLSGPHKALQLLTFALGVPPALVVSALCRLAGRGGTLLAVARK